MGAFINTHLDKKAENQIKELSWVDCSALIIGIMLATGIFVVFPTLAAAHTPSVLLLLISWSVGAGIAWCGALCYAELSCLYPVNGGDYVFLREAYSHKDFSPLSFLFGWGQIFVIRPASLISLSIVFGLNFKILFMRFCQGIGIPVPEEPTLQFLVGFAIVFLLILFTCVAMRGVKVSKTLQNGLTLIKLFLLLLLIISGLWLGRKMTGNLAPLLFLPEENIGDLVKRVGMALIPVMWVFGGWNEAPYVAGEVKDPVRNIPRALTAGILVLSVLYLLVNVVYMLHFTPKGLGENWTFASDLMKNWFGESGEIVMASVILVASAGAVNGLIFTGGRMTSAFAEDFHSLKWFAKIDKKKSTPKRALLFNLIIILGMILLLDLKPETINSLLYFTSGVVWIFFSLIVGSVFIFRQRNKEGQIPFKIPFYPLPPLVFIVMSAVMLKAALDYKYFETGIGILFLCAGIPVYAVIHCLMTHRPDFKKQV